MTKTMQALGIKSYGQAIQLMTVPIPTITANEVLVAIQATSLNPVDFKIGKGNLKMLLHYQMPLILGNDFAGVVTQVGANVTTFKVGDAVYGRPNKQKIGTFAEYIAVAATDIARQPTNLSFEAAAALPLVTLTAYQGLTELMQLQPGQRILIQAGAGGVGSMAIQLAKELGAYVTTTASANNQAFLQELGADQVIDYRTTAFETVLSDYDFVFDTLGGDQLKRAFQIVKPGGRIVSVSGIPNARFGRQYGLKKWQIGLLAMATYPLSRLEKQTQVTYDFLFMHPSGQQLALMTDWVNRGRIQPIIDRVVPFADFQKAIDYLAAGHARGKVILKLPAKK